MLNRYRCLAALTFAMTLMTLCNDLQAQTLVRDDLPVVTFNFDDGFTVTQEATLMEQHMIAQQQVEYALEYLKTAKSTILAGADEQFNRFFGGFYDPANPLSAAANQTNRSVSLLPVPVSGLVYVEEGLTQQFEVRGDEDTSFFTQVKPGDLIYIHRSRYRPGLVPTGGYLREVQEVVDNNLLIIGVNWIPGRGRIDPSLGSALPPIDENSDARFMSLAILGNLRADEKLSQTSANSIHYDRVVATFEALRRNLAGFVTYQGERANAGSAAFIRQYANTEGLVFNGPSGAPRGSSTGTIFELSGLTNTDTNVTGPTFANRAFRQDGYSNSQSGEQRRALVPWSSDDGIIDSLAYNQDGTLNTNAGNGTQTDYWFQNFMTIWGNNRNPSTQNVGASFFNGARTFAEPDPGLSADPFRIFSDPNYFDDGNRLTATNFAGLPAMWQMIIESFAEKDNQFGNSVFLNGGGTFDGLGTIIITDSSAQTPSGTAFTGVRQFLEAFFDEDTNPDTEFLEARDASSYAGFAFLFNDALPDGVPSISTIAEPPGKRTTAGFAPDIPESRWWLNWVLADP